MKKILSTLALAAFGLLSAQAHAAGAACEKSADDMKLAGAARTAHVKKCEREHGAAAPNAACEKSAADKKLAGAAKSSHLKKCMADSAAPAKS